MAREMIPHRQTIISMGWPQPKSPIQTDNSTTSGVTNKTIVPCLAKMMDMRFWWLRCRVSQDWFCYYWDAGSKNLGWLPHQTPTGYLPWSPPKYSCRHLGPGRHITLLPILPNYWLAGFPLQVFPFYFFSSTNYYPHIMNVATRVCRSPQIPRMDRQSQI